MKSKTKPAESAPMRTEYEFAGGERGKYAAAYAAGTNIVALDPDVAAAFPDAQAVNTALRGLLQGLKARDTPQAA